LGCLLFDIEGTITSLAFVKEELFPYARLNLPSFLSANADRPDVASILERLTAIVGTNDLDQVASELVRWIDEDRKQTDLKELQGLIWEEGYRSGAYRGHLYPDVVPFWRTMRARGEVLAIYSSGSEQAQRLLLTYSVEGDVSALIDRHFDTRVGPKQEPASYQLIAHELGLAPAELEFFSDSVEELDSASQVGMRTCRLIRPGVPSVAHRHPNVPTLMDIGG